MITPRENILRIFRHEMPEWIPVIGHCDPYSQPNREGMDPKLADALENVKWYDESTVILSRHLGLDIMDYADTPVKVKRRSVVVESAEDGTDTIETWYTQEGSLRQVRRQCREDGTSYLVEHLVKGPDDLPALIAIFTDEQLELDHEAVEKIRRRRNLIAEDGMLICFLPGTPLGMMYRMYSSVEALVYLYADVPVLLRNLFEVMENNYRRKFELTVQSEVDALVGMDDTSTTVISPRMFEEFNLELTDERARVCHEAGKLYFHHSCGLIRNLLSLYRRTHMDGVHGFNAPPTGDVTIAEGREMLGNRITIMGGIGSMADERWDFERVRSDVQQLYTDAGRGDHFIMGIGAWPHVTVTQTRAVVEECRKYGEKTLSKLA